MGLLTVELKEFNSASLTSEYQNFGSTLSGSAIKIQFLNTSTVDAYVTDGTSTFRIPSSTTVTFDEANPKTSKSDSNNYLASGAQLQIKQVTGAGSGTVIAHVITKR